MFIIAYLSTFIMEALKSLSDNPDIASISLLTFLFLKFRLRAFCFLAQWGIFIWNLDMRVLCYETRSYLTPPSAAGRLTPSREFQVSSQLSVALEGAGSFRWMGAPSPSTTGVRNPAQLSGRPAEGRRIRYSCCGATISHARCVMAAQARVFGWKRVVIT